MTSGNNITPDKGKPMMDVAYNDPNLTYAGWQVSEEDLVNYRDVERRGLQFMFSLMRTATSSEMNSPLNKLVSVYQKNDEGDFVIVSMAANNPNDIRVMEMTNEYFGEQYDNEPERMIQKVIEMADDSGMIRNIAEYGEFGKTDCFVETAGAMHDEFRQNVGKDAYAAPTASKVTGHSDLAGKVASAVMSVAALPAGRKVNGPQFLSRIANIFSRRSKADPAALQTLKHEHKMTEIGATMAGKATIEEAKLGTAKEITGMKTDAVLGAAQVRAEADKYKAIHQRHGAEDVARIKGQYGVEQAKAKGKYDVKKEETRQGILSKSQSFKKVAAGAATVGSLSGAYSPFTSTEKAYKKSPAKMDYNRNANISKMGKFPSVTPGSTSNVASTNVSQHPNVMANTPVVKGYVAPKGQGGAYGAMNSTSTMPKSGQVPSGYSTQTKPSKMKK